MQVFIGPLLEEGRLKSIIIMHYLIHLLMESLKLFYSPNVSVSYAFVYDGVNISKIIVISSTKLPIHK